METFEEATERFRQFLISRGYTAEPLWIFRYDVLGSRRRMWIHCPLPDTNFQENRAEYQRGEQLGFGVELSTFCIMDGRPCCYVYVPESAAEASHMMIADVKLRIQEKPPTAIPVRNRLLWGMLRLIYRGAWWDEMLPVRR